MRLACLLTCISGLSYDHADHRYSTLLVATLVLSDLDALMKQ